MPAPSRRRHERSVRPNNDLMNALFSISRYNVRDCANQYATMSKLCKHASFMFSGGRLDRQSIWVLLNGCVQERERERKGERDKASERVEKT